METPQNAPLLFVYARHTSKVSDAKALIERGGVDINAVHGGLTALDYAILARNEDMVRLLVSQPDIKLRKQPAQHRSSLYYALAYAPVTPPWPYPPVIPQLLFDHEQINVNDTDIHGNSTFYNACVFNRWDIVKLLLSPKYRNQLNTNVSDNRKFTPSHVVSYWGRARIIKLMIEGHCFQPFAENTDAKNPLELACSRGQLNAVKVILDDIQKQASAGVIDKMTKQQYLLRALDGSAVYGQEDAFKAVIQFVNLLKYHWKLFLNLEVSIDRLKERTVGVICVMLLPFIKHAHKKFMDALMKQAIFVGMSSMVRYIYAIWVNITPETDDVRRRLHEYYKEVDPLAFEQEDDPDTLILYHACRHRIPHLISLMCQFIRSAPNRDQLLKKTLASKSISIEKIAHKCPEAHDIFRKNGFQIDESEERRQWYTQLKRFTSDVTAKNKIPRDQLESSMKTIFDSVMSRMNENDDNEEKRQVYDVIDALLQEVSHELAKVNPLFRYRPVLVGGAKERTRPFEPNEFDFLLICEEAQRHLDVTMDDENHSVAKVSVKPSGRTNSNFKQFLTSHGSFDVDEFKQQMDKALKRVMMSVFHDGPYRGHLTVDARFLVTKRISSVTVCWRGQRYKDMEISIDLVPAFEFRDYTPRQPYTDGPCTYYIFLKTKVLSRKTAEPLYPIAFSDVEVKIITGLPKNAHLGYKLAKALRTGLFVPREVAEKWQLHNLEDYLVTYMLKTCMMHLYLHLKPNLPELAPEQWAHMIYAHLYYRLEDGAIPHVFEGDAKVDRSSHLDIFFCTDRDEVGEDEESACCVKKRTLMDVAAWLMHVLEVSFKDKYTTEDWLRIGKTAESAIVRELSEFQLDS